VRWAITPTEMSGAEGGRVSEWPVSGKLDQDSIRQVLLRVGGRPCARGQAPRAGEVWVDGRRATPKGGNRGPC
jgi:hypothetical protein